MLNTHFDMKVQTCDKGSLITESKDQIQYKTALDK